MDDRALRTAAFDWIQNQTSKYGPILKRRPLLEQGFQIGSLRIPLLGASGIFKPKAASYPLSITTTPDSPYTDTISEFEILEYRYRGTNPNFWDNVALKQAMVDQVPLIYFHGVAKNRYLANWPVFIIGANDNTLTFEVSLAESVSLVGDIDEYQISEDISIQKAYKQQLIKQRIHQHKFRERVLEAYRTSCAVCNLKHRELLDAAHIVPDSEPNSIETVSNGLSLCKLHHAAFDSLFIGISPDYKIYIRGDILSETDGPVLQHGLKNLHNQNLRIPRRRALKPNPDFLDWRFSKFRSAG
ncbi:MAG: HNH endonuclease [Candidatus Marinimicrobia bacterium]|nr:HNH endonuclease [FCB group bacterium]MBL7024917.1 HNH endonuclease [Candidatus Neomarinimicrobiota bacterium]